MSSFLRDVMPRPVVIVTFATLGILILILSVALWVARRANPHSEWLAFTNYSDADLYLVKTDGTLRRVTTDIVYYPLDPVWDGLNGWLFYTNNSAVKRVRLANGLSETFLSSPSSAYYQPTPAKNGHWVYFVQATNNNGTEIWRRSIGGRTQQLTFFYPRQMVVEGFALSPNEQWIAAWVISTQYLTMARQIMVFPIGGDPRPIITDAFTVDSVAWSPDGEWLMIAYYTEDAPRIVRVRRDGSEMQTLYQFVGRDANIGVEWSPDGRWVAYNAPCNPDVTFVGCLWLVSTDDWQPRILYSFGNGQAINRGWVGPPHWSSDSQTLAFAQLDTSNRGLRSLYLIGLNGGKPTRVAYPILGDEFSWSPLIASGNLSWWLVGLGFGMVVGAGWITIKKIVNFFPIVLRFYANLMGSLIR